jgi:hypothetical protein
MLFDRIDGSNPFHLCDGHTLESYRPWKCCIGVPSGMLVRHVGDSVEQNGTFNIECKKANADTVTAKIRAGLPATPERSDIVRIVNVTRQKSFARVETNKKVTAARGWGPLN